MVAYAPFTEADKAKIAQSYMHQAHAAADKTCAECHDSTDTSKLVTQSNKCEQCHAKQQPKQEVWRGHCLMCHDFTAPKAEGRLTPPKQDKCLQCHSEEKAGAGLYGFYRADSKMQFACGSCHNPHTEQPVGPPKMCSICHGEMAKTDLLKQGHVNCSACHTPHSWVFAAKQGCLTCHAQPPRVNVHLIGVHPQDCTQCHSPHFTDNKLRGAQCQTCHSDKVYKAGRNQPKAHLECLNCHSQRDWGFKGGAACATCHSEQGAVLANTAAPDKHKQCAACHLPHNFRTSFSQTCQRCHKLDAVFEHRLPFHPKDACSVCHDAHLATMPPKSGSCDACHGEAIPKFALPAPEPHTECVNCHSQESIDGRKFEFVGTENSCQVCHALASTEPEVAWDQAPSGHLMCNGCHPAHTWQVEAGANTCGVCHGDVVEATAASGMPDCFTCHEANHLAKFVGADSSCNVCHAQQAEETAGGPKADCSMCHAQHNFKADPASCTVCHTDLPGTHSPAGHAECLNCHTMHSLKVDPSVCTVCHTDRAEHFPGQVCQECHKFKAEN